MATAESLASLSQEEQMKVLELIAVNFNLAQANYSATEMPAAQIVAAPQVRKQEEEAVAEKPKAARGRRKGAANTTSSSGTTTKRAGRPKKEVNTDNIPFPELSSIPGKSRREQQFNIAVLAALEAKKQGVNAIPMSDVRNLCKKYDCLDTNFSNNFKREKDLFMLRGKGRTSKLILTEAGESLAKELNPNESSSSTLNSGSVAL